MATATSKPRKTAAARPEANGRGKTVPFHGLTLLLPPEAPGDLMFSVPDNETSVALRSIFGLDQYQQIREKCVEKKWSLVKVAQELDALVGKCFAEWDLTAGE